mmetsp:Transcript_82021/g.240788  ORF Transcript_82021/g.240788 Transcript_82021/m.240788 type:complete len:359 (+) Transcript_82021:500-1576(+)
MLISSEDSRAKEKSAKSIPTPTAVARSVNSVTSVTARMMTASKRRIFFSLVVFEKTFRLIFSGMAARTISFSDFQSKVWNTTLNITPTSAETGMQLIAGPATTTMIRRETPAVIEDTRCRAPEPMLIMDCPIMAQPPIPAKAPHTMLATPWPTHSLLVLLRPDLVSSSIKFRVISDSSKPTAAIVTASVETCSSVSRFRGFGVYWLSNHRGIGKFDRNFSAAMSPTVVVSLLPSPRTTAHSRAVPSTTATNAEGTRVVSLGKNRQVKKDKVVMRPANIPSIPLMKGFPSVKASNEPSRRTSALSWRFGTLKLLNCAKPITRASPLQKPIMTELGISFTSEPTCASPRTICSSPISITA